MHGRFAIGRVLALLLALLLSACASSSDPFGKDDPKDGGPTGKAVPPITILSTSGMPPDRASVLIERMTELGGQRDIAFVEGAFDDGTLGLAGTFSASPGSSSSRLSFSWTLSDKSGTVLHQFSGEESGASSGTGDPWGGITPGVLERAAAKSVKSIAERLSELGYATRTAAHLPPSDALIAAGPADERALDYETINGPGSTTASISPPAAPVEEGRAEAPIEPEPAAKPARKAEHTIKAVAVVPVKGAPGKGNDELTAAMRSTLAKAGWPVVKSPRADALTIAGQVKLGPKAGDGQNVSLAWNVVSPDGAVLGTIKQSNTVAAGSLDKGFGQAAGYAAEAAATGIYDLIKKYR